MSPRAAVRLEQFGVERVYDYVGGKADWAAAGLPVEGMLGEHPAIRDATTEALTCSMDATPAEVRRLLDAAGEVACVVVGDGKVVLGRVQRDDLDRAADDAGVEALMEEGPSTFRPNVPLDEILERMHRHGVEEVLVTTQEGVLLGRMRLEDAERVIESSAHFHD